MVTRTSARTSDSSAFRPVLPALEVGDRLDQKTFHQRYQAMPPETRAELIGGIVYMPSPLKRPHGKMQPRLSHWILTYNLATSGTEVLESATTPEHAAFVGKLQLI